MKKLISLFLSILMVVSLFTGVAVNAVAGEGSVDHQYYFFNPANIVDGTDWGITNVFDTRGVHKGDDRLIPTIYNATNGTYDHASGAMYVMSLVTAPAGGTKSLAVYNKANTTKRFRVFMNIAHDQFPLNTLKKDSTRYVQEDPYTELSEYRGKSSWELAVNGGTKSAISLGNYPFYSDPDQTKITWQEFRFSGANNSGYVHRKVFDWFVKDVILQPGWNTLDLQAGADGGIIESIFVTDNATLTTSDLYYEGSWHSRVMMGVTSNSAYHINNVVYFADGEYKEDRTGLINMQLYSDNCVPTASITNGGTQSSDPASITVNFTADDPALHLEDADDVRYIGGRTASGLDAPGALISAVPGTFPFVISEASGIAEIKVYRNDVLVDTISGAATSWVDDGTGLADGFEEGTPYTYKIEAYDFFGNKAESTEATITSYGEPDTTGPTWTGDTVTVEDAGLSSTISWPAAEDDRKISAYEIYEGSKAPENLRATTTTTSCTIDLALNETKNVLVYAKDSAENYTETGLPATIQSRPGTEHFLMRVENFDMPEAALKLWDAYQLSGDETTMLGTRLNAGAKTNHSYGKKARVRSSGSEISAKIWVDTPGDYAAYMLVEQNGSGVHLTMNDQITSKALGSTAVKNESGTSLIGWVKADRIFNLKEGWNTITAKSVGDSGSFVALYITDGTAIKADELTYRYNNAANVAEGKINTAVYDDIAGPTFAAGDITVVYDTTANTAEISWPTATDMPETATNASTYQMMATGLHSYKVYVNDTEIGEVDNATTTFPINETTFGRKLALGETIKIKVEALDIYGNKTVKELDYEVSKFVVSNFHIESGSAPADMLLLLDDGTVKATATIKNVSEAPEGVRLAIAIYDNATGQLLYGNVAEETIASGVDHPITATITGARTDLTGCTVKAHLWDANYAPIASTIVISE